MTIPALARQLTLMARVDPECHPGKGCAEETRQSDTRSRDAGFHD